MFSFWHTVLVTFCYQSLDSDCCLLWCRCGCENYPLLKTINRVLRDYSTPDPRCDQQPALARYTLPATAVYSLPLEAVEPHRPLWRPYNNPAALQPLLSSLQSELSKSVFSYNFK